MAKVIFADNILKRKGIEKKSFDTGRLNELVENFFMNNPPEAKILLRSKRFVEMKNPPEGDIIDMLDDSIWEKRAEDPNDEEFTFFSYLTMSRQGLIMPTLIINEPFIGNAAAYLRTLCGFTVKSRVRNKQKQYSVRIVVLSYNITIFAYNY